MIISLVACGSGAENSSNSEKKQSDGGPEITDSGYYVSSGLDSDIYLYWGAKVKNTSESSAYELYTITITAKDADGNVVATEDQVMNKIQPGEEQAAGFLMDCNGEVPDSVEFTIDEGDAVSADDTAIKSSDIEISGTDEKQGDFGDTVFTGTLKNNSETDAESLLTTVLLYKDGKIIYGDSTFVDNVKAGNEKGFEIDEYGVPDDYDSYKIYASDWTF